MAEGTDFLYPFLGDDDGRDPGALLDDLAASAVAKAATSLALQRATLAATAGAVRDAAGAMAERFAAGGRLLTFGNGGSSTDAAGLAELFTRPPWGTPLPARCLVDDQAVLTALGNDVGFDLVFGRQIIAHGTAVDIALGLSTSGNSRNLLVAFEEAASRGLLTVGLAGYDGGDMARSPYVEHCLVVEADSIHRIQESQAAVAFSLWAEVQQRERAGIHG
jgi:D-sedoheptulose 7-phosphate isomerase